MLAQHAAAVSIRLLDGRSHDALAACDVTLIASGTATLEAALFKRPMVIAYRMNTLSWQMMRRMQYQSWVGLPNILCEDFVVPERLQGDADPDTLASDVLAWLDAPARTQALARRFTELHHLLRLDTARTATDAIAQIVGQT
jgi:lipid-A-disaccharide synthase